MIRRRLWPTVLCAALLALAACSEASDPATGRWSGNGPTVAQADASPSASPSQASPSSSPPTAEVTVAFAGDVHFTGRTAKLLRDPATAIGPTSEVFSAADLAMVNLESAITEGGTPEPKQYHFRAPASALTALKSAGIDVATMANNHALDYGQAGLKDTLAAISASGYPVVGIGRTATDAYAPWVTTVRGTRIAFLGFSQMRELAPQWTATATRAGVASALEVDVATAAVRAARKVADVVVVYMHWGKEGSSCPTDRMKVLAKALADAGADAVVSTHAHVMLGDGYLGRTYVQYGLSNFVWWLDDAYSNDTGIVTISLSGRQVTKAAFTPVRISKTGQPVVATGATATRIAAKYAQLRGCTGLAAAPSTG